MKNLLIHAGYPKTGTTNLQNNLFEKHNEIQNLANVSRMDEIRKEICQCENISTKKMKNYIRGKLRNSPKCAAVYSEEGYTSSPMLRRKNAVKYSTISKRLNETFSLDECNTTLLLVVREQKQLILSHYTFWHKEYKKKGLKDVNQFVQEVIRRNKRQMEWLNYNSMLNKFEKNFENVEALAYKNMLNNERIFTENICRMVDVSVKEGRKIAEGTGKANSTKIRGKRKIPGRLYKTLSNIKKKYLSKLPSISRYRIGRIFLDYLKQDEEVVLSSKSKELIREMYLNSNKEVENRYGISI